MDKAHYLKPDMTESLIAAYLSNTLVGWVRRFLP